MAWATIADVLAITGRTVTSDQIAQAQYLVELLADRTEDEIGTDAAEGTAGDWTGRTRDLRRLRDAVAWQAAHLEAQAIDLAALPAGVASISQPDLAVTFTGDGLELRRYVSPITLHAVRRLTWRRNRSVPIGSLHDPGDTGDGEDMTGEPSGTSWTPIGGGD